MPPKTSLFLHGDNVTILPAISQFVRVYYFAPQIQNVTIISMSWILILKLIVVAIFLIMFLRRPTLTWGVGLLCVTTAVLLDTFLGTFDTMEMMAELGFFFYIIAGGLVGGMAVWAWGVLKPVRQAAAVSTGSALANTPVLMPNQVSRETAVIPPTDTAYDRQMLYQEIQTRFGVEDIFDLIFDLGIKENDVMPLNNDPNQLIINIINLAENNGQTGDLALAVERILTPIPADALPRLEKIGVNSPPTILRHYLIANYTIAQLQALAVPLEIDWDELGSGGKKTNVRNLLLYLYRRNRIDEFIQLMKAPLAEDEEE